jgi:hypothetical protein
MHTCRSSAALRNTYHVAPLSTAVHEVHHARGACGVPLRECQSASSRTRCSIRASARCWRGNGILSVACDVSQFRTVLARPACVCCGDPCGTQARTATRAPEHAAPSPDAVRQMTGQAKHCPALAFGAARLSAGAESVLLDSLRHFEMARESSSGRLTPGGPCAVQVSVR